MKANVKNKQNESKLYRLIEMKDSMEKSIDNAKQVLEEQNLLVKIVNDTDEETRKKFENFLNDMNETNTDLSSQINTLEKRKDMLEKVIQTCTENKEFEDFTNDVLDAFGVFKD